MAGKVVVKVCQLCAVDFTLKHFLLPLIDAMGQQSGWHVTTVCSDGPFVAPLRAQGYRIETVSISRSLNLFSALRSLWALVLLFKREQFDVLHVHTPVAALLGRIAGKIVGIPLVVYTAHGFYFHDDMPMWKRRFFLALEKFGGRWTDVLFTQSAEDASTAQQQRIVPKDRIFAIGNGVSVNRFDPLRINAREKIRQDLNIPHGAFVVGFIGRQVIEKGIVEFLQAACSVGAQQPNAWFLLIGERLQSDHCAGVKEHIINASSFLGSRLVVTGLREDIPELLSAMDLFCLPSWREGMPRTIIEAMMMSLPVLATNIRGSREEVEEGKTGILVPPRDGAALAQGMMRFLDNVAWSIGLGVAGRCKALQLYDEKKIVAFQVKTIKSFARKLHF